MNGKQKIVRVWEFQDSEHQEFVRIKGMDSIKWYRVNKDDAYPYHYTIKDVLNDARAITRGYVTTAELYKYDVVVYNLEWWAGSAHLQGIHNNVYDKREFDDCGESWVIFLLNREKFDDSEIE